MIDLRSRAADTDLDPYGGEVRFGDFHLDDLHLGDLYLDDTAQVRFAAGRLAAGVAVAHGFGNVYAITSRGDAATVRRVNQMKGRPADQTGSIAAPARAVSRVFDWSALAPDLDRTTVQAILDAFLQLGPFGFRGPAAAHIPFHLSTSDGPVRTAQVIAPGYSCPSNRFLELAAEAVGGEPLYVTSANRSRPVAGADQVGAHWRAQELQNDFGPMVDLIVLAHADEAAARERYPRHRSMTTTVLGFHRPRWHHGRVHLSLERHGSLSADTVAAVLERFDIGLYVTSSGRTRRPVRGYAHPRA